MLNSENRYLFKFAWRSLRRNTGRSFFIGFSVSLAVMIAIWVVAFFEGMNHQIEEAVVNTNTGYFQVLETKFAKTTDASAPLEYSANLQRLLAIPPITSLSPELVLDANILTPEGAAGLVVLGVDPNLHQEFLPIGQNTVSGSFLNETDEGQVVIGRELARLFKFSVEDQLVLNYQDMNGELRSELLTIKGIYHYNSQSFEKRFVYLNQKTWQQLFFNEDKGKILFNRIAIKVPNINSEPVIKQRAQALGLHFKNWKNLNPEMGVVLDFHDGMIRFFFLIIGVTIIMTILTPVRMLWQERLKELKMLNILGVTKGKFWKIGIFEVMQMTFLAGLSSSILLSAIIGLQSQTGLDFRFLNDGVAIERAGIKLPGIIYPKLTLEQILATFIFVVLVITVSYVWSIHKTLQKLEEVP